MKIGGYTAMRVVAAGLVTAVMAACASIGHPEGGPRDEEPPAFVRSDPQPGALNVKTTRINAWFDENIQLDDAFNKVIVSPTQTTAPVVRALGRHLSVELRDTLVPNATYTIDFADAIKDLNEGNVLDGFALDFATGDTFDSLRISGVVLEARTLEPAKGMLVGIHSNLSDTAIVKLPFDRVARTNQYGQFTIRNLKAGKYNVFAINDVNRDNRWDATEDIAFAGYAVSPYAESIEVIDSLRTPDGRDSLVTRPGTAFLPNDVLLAWFNEGRLPLYLRDHARPQRNLVTLGMSRATDSLPDISVVGGSLDGRPFVDMTVPQVNATRDTLAYWLRDPDLLATDSLRLSVRHQVTDSAFAITWQTDTINFFWREPKKKDKKKAESDTIPAPVPTFDIKAITQKTHEVYSPIVLEVPVPLASIDTLGVHFEQQNDTLWVPAHLTPLDAEVLTLRYDFDRTPGETYRLRVDSAAMVDIYGVANKEFTHELKVRNLDEYSNLVLNVQGTDSVPVWVELLDTKDEPVRVGRLGDDRKVAFDNVTPGTYYARLWLDVNDNGRWDTGNVADSLQAEEVYYYPAKLELRANWDLAQTWDIYERPIDAQKPRAILKNKPTLRKGEKEPVDDDETQLDEWGEPIKGNSAGNRGTQSTPRRGLGVGVQTNQNSSTIRQR